MHTPNGIVSNFITGSDHAHKQHGRELSSTFSDSPILTNTLNNIPPPPALTRTCTHSVVTGPIHSKSRSTHKASRHRRSIPHLHPQTTVVNCSSTPSRVDDQPPVLHRLHDRIDSSNIPPPPRLLPMSTCTSQSVTHPQPLCSISSAFRHSVPGSLSNGDSYKPSLVQSSDFALSTFHQQSPLKSMHASLQDLIADEFCRDSVPPTPEQSSKLFTNLPQPIVTHPFILPPRKRVWDSTIYEQQQPMHKCIKNESPVASAPQLSPPTLSPVERGATQSPSDILTPSKPVFLHDPTASNLLCSPSVLNISPTFGFPAETHCHSVAAASSIPPCPVPFAQAIGP